MNSNNDMAVKSVVYDGAGNLKYNADTRPVEVVSIVEQRGNVVVYKHHDAAVAFVKQLRDLGITAHVTTHKVQQ